ncbi:hypothetical protein PtA15_4A716 [Puccinia triticina]|uniref:Uncharacterized protein n=1 Tax=Puccinia triticina TaxID=208348 RepID=A0ABY7CGD2_9BASI|nr:uncharacterized protein PtA15_4A716 [Puccinia triticina]WAQ84263.1 hypothetical protein PtA15_4A716 [Puccinia triticina]
MAANQQTRVRKCSHCRSSILHQEPGNLTNFRSRRERSKEQVICKDIAGWL